MATRAFERRSSRHLPRSSRRMRAGFARSVCSCSRRSLPQAACPLCQLPGTDVGCPCKNACVDAESLPCRNSSCTSGSHSSCVRSHVTSLRLVFRPAPDQLLQGAAFCATPCAAELGLLPGRRRAAAQGATNPPTELRLPPKGRVVAHPAAYFCREASRTSSRQRSSRRASSSALTTHNSSSSRHRQPPSVLLGV